MFYFLIQAPTQRIREDAKVEYPQVNAASKWQLIDDLQVILITVHLVCFGFKLPIDNTPLGKIN